MLRPICILLATCFSWAALAQAPGNLVRIRGNVESFDGKTLNVKARNNQSYAVKVPGNLLVIGVNTVRAARHKNGEVSDGQIERVGRQLREASAAQLRIVVTHQPVHVIRESDVTNLLINHERAIAAWAAAGADLVLGGHIHLPYVRPLNTEKRALASELWSVQAGTALSTRIRDGISNSFNVIHHDPVNDPGSCVVEHWDYNEANGRFDPGGKTTIPVQR